MSKEERKIVIKNTNVNKGDNIMVVIGIITFIVVNATIVLVKKK